MWERSDLPLRGWGVGLWTGLARRSAELSWSGGLESLFFCVCWYKNSKNGGMI